MIQSWLRHLFGLTGWVLAPMLWAYGTLLLLATLLGGLLERLGQWIDLKTGSPLAWLAHLLLPYQLHVVLACLTGLLLAATFRRKILAGLILCLLIINSVLYALNWPA
ncbi:MAG: hypothetical protein KC475_01795 [Cyanobacteria bacterium HKST-UBA03]|nr:hypothetical protein [Cyanobacteria bacterium HKST-UBA03]